MREISPKRPIAYTEKRRFELIYWPLNHSYDRRSWRKSQIFLISSLAVGLVGCAPFISSSGEGHGYVTADLLGTWKSENGKVEMTISATGDVSFKNWPSNLECTEPLANYVEDIDWGKSIDLEGHWRGGMGAAVGNFVLVARTDSGCEGGINVLIYDDPDQPLRLGVTTESVIDPDAIRPNQEVVFRRARQE